MGAHVVAATRPRPGPVRTTPMARVACRTYLGRGCHHYSVAHLPATTGGRCATSRTQRWPASRDPLDVIKTTITVAGFVGAVLVGVYGYRKQRLVEGDARRADAEQPAQRYTTAAASSGMRKPLCVSLVSTPMARLADDWVEQRQVCLDVLCAYLRMPYEPDAASEKPREGEREVRYTIIRIIRDHLRDPSAPTTWCGRDLDFTNATFDGGDFGGAKFTGDKVSFDRAKFTDGEVSFEGAEFGDMVP
jgi:Pentapeptide repeats (9 copies)